LNRQSLVRHKLKYYVDKLANDEPFGLARYGDGEWMTILGYIGRNNSNGCTFTQELHDKLMQVLRNDHPYEHAILRIAYRKLGDEIEEFLDRENIEVEWTIGDTMLDMSLKGKLWPLVNQLRNKRVLYVGPEFLTGLHTKFFRLVGYVQVPRVDASEHREIIVPAILSMMYKYQPEVVGFSSGLHSKVFIDDVWAEFMGRVTLIDFGSMWDGYFAIPSRSYIRKGGLDWDNLHKQNVRNRPLPKEDVPPLPKIVIDVE